MFCKFVRAVNSFQYATICLISFDASVCSLYQFVIVYTSMVIICLSNFCLQYSIKIIFNFVYRLDESGVQIKSPFRQANHRWDEITAAGIQAPNADSDKQTLRQMGSMFTKVFENLLRSSQSRRFILFKKTNGKLVHMHIPPDKLEEVSALFSKFLQQRFTNEPQDYFELRRTLGKRVNIAGLAFGVLFFLLLASAIFAAWVAVRSSLGMLDI